jgi:hypothetical protein
MQLSNPPLVDQISYFMMMDGAYDWTEDPHLVTSHGEVTPMSLSSRDDFSCIAT